jgi:hypothetical protein
MENINEVDDSVKTVSDSHSQIDEQDKIRPLQSVPVGLSPVMLDSIGELNVGNKRSKYAKSNTSSAIMPHTPEVTIQAPTPAKGAQTSEEKVDNNGAKVKSKRMNYAKKNWASTPVDNIVTNSTDRFGKMMPMQFDPNFMNHNMGMMGSSHRRNSPPPGMQDGKFIKLV